MPELNFVTMRVDVPKVALTDAYFQSAWEAELRRQMGIAERLLRKTHANWGKGPARTPSGFFQKLEYEEVNWTSRVGKGSVSVGEDSISVTGLTVDMYGVVSTDSQKYKFVNSGTSYRAVKMSPDFSPKTQHRRIASGSGSGHASHWGRKPGIAAREFTEAVAEQRYPAFVKSAGILTNKLAARFWK